MTSSSKPTFSVVYVTPEMAERWLGKNLNNRTVSKRHVESMAVDMAEGRWEFTAEPIKFSSDEVLRDGQHRLLAVIVSGKTVPFLVARDISARAQLVMDTGRKRSAADALSLVGEKNATTLAAAARIALAIDAGRDTKGFNVTNSQVEQFLDNCPGDIRAAADFAGKPAKKTGAAPSVVAYTTWRFSMVDYQDAFEFWTAAAEKTGLRAGDPVIALTDRYLLAAKNSEYVSPRSQVDLIFRCWNARRQGKPMTQAKVRRGNVVLPRLR